MAEITINAFDGVAVVFILLGARAGFINGIADALWPLLRWSAMLAAGAAAWEPFGQELARLTGFGLVPSSEAAYLSMAVAASVSVTGLYRLFSQRITFAIPGGRIDCLLGIVAGAGASAAILLNLYAILNPFVAAVEWNPETKGYDSAAQDLVAAVVAAIRNAALEGSWIGRAVQEHLGMLLIRP